MSNSFETTNTKLKFVNLAIVLVSAGLSPNLYTPNYLVEKEIINPALNWKVSGNITNDLVSLVLLESGKVTIKIEKTKVTISDNIFVESQISDNGIVDITKRFLEKHNHLGFTALGINYVVVAEMQQTQDFLLHKFINKDYWNADGYKVATTGLKLTYPLNSGELLNISLDEGGVETKTPKGEDDISGIICQANFHYNYTLESDTPDIISSLNSIEENRKTLNKILKSIFE